MPILVGILPSITARKGLAGRAVVAKAFEQYFRNEGHKKGSVLAKNRYEVAAKNGIALEDIAKYEVGGAIAVLVNTTPAAFWTLFFIYSTPGLLENIRKEIDQTVISTNNGDGLTRSVDIKNLKQHCPLLISTFQETLRILRYWHLGAPSDGRYSVGRPMAVEKGQHGADANSHHSQGSISLGHGC